MKLIQFIQNHSNTKKFIIINLIFLFFTSNYAISSLNCRGDFSGSHRFSITKSTEKVLKNLPDTLFIDAYYSSEIPGEYRSRLILTQELLKEMANVNRKKVELRILDPDSSDEIKKKAISQGVEPQTLQKVERGSAEVKQAFFGIVLTLEGKTEVLPVAFFAEQLEYQILSTLKRMTRGNSSSGIAVLNMEGAHEYPPPSEASGKDTYGIFLKQSLESEAGSVLGIDVNQESIPNDIHSLIWVGAPRFDEKGRFHIDQFLMRGGNLIILMKTMYFDIQPTRGMMGIGMGNSGVAQAVPGLGELNAFLSHYGLQSEPEMLLDPNHSMPMGSLVEVQPGVIGRYHYPLWILLHKSEGNFSSSSPYSQTTEGLLLPWVSGIISDPTKQPEAKYEDVLNTSPTTGRRKDFVLVGEETLQKMVIQPEGKPIPVGVSVEGKLTSYFQGKTLPTGVESKGYLMETNPGSSSKIFMIGTPYFLSDLLALREFREIFQEANIPFFYNMMDILKNEPDMLEVRTRTSSLKAMSPVSKGVQVFVNVFNIIIIPLGLGIYAFVRLHKRKKGATNL
jgi:ABC-type uncharacterized transport system involved in gliding motility auxiliary subunit